MTTSCLNAFISSKNNNFSDIFCNKEMKFHYMFVIF